MDPDATLKEILGFIKDIFDEEDKQTPSAIDLANHVESLHTWITKGGYLPTAWK